MGATTVRVESGDYHQDAQKVSREFFGGNMLFDRDRVGENGTYDEKAAALNLGMIRYPGGNVSEIFFDISDPEKSVEANGHSGSLMPLSEFLDYVNGAGVSAAFVAPTVPFMDGLATGEMTIAEVRSEMRAFLTKLKAGVYGDATAIRHIEIGNEYYGYEKHFDWSAIDQYIEIAPIWAAEIRKVFGDDLQIAVQGGINRVENDRLVEAFEGKGDLVDTVIFHSYPWDLGQVYSHDAWKNGLADKWKAAGVADQVFLSEWGISNQRVDATGELLDPSLIEDGLARAIGMVEMAALQIRAGVDFATVWPVQQNTRGDLAGNEGQTAENSAHFLSEDGLTVAGEAFQMMAEVLPGMKMLDMGGAIDLDGKREDDRYASEVLVRGFEDDKKIVIFVSAWAIGDSLGEATVNLKLGGDIASYDVTTLTVAGDNYTNANADPVTIEETGLQASGNLSITFARDYELKRIVLNKADGDKAQARPGSNEDDAVGNIVRGGDGFDFLKGGEGYDILLGGRDADRLKGEGADDRLKGQHGDDTLHGGRGEDTMLGGGQQDKLIGGAGADVLRGGGGSDMLNGGGGADLLKGNGGDDRLVGRGGDDRLNGGAGDDTLLGGAGDDVLEIGPGEDIAYGGAGADVFIIRPSAEAATIADFQAGEDLIEFHQANAFADLAITRDGADAIVSAGQTSVILEDVNPASLGALDFIF